MAIFIYTSTFMFTMLALVWSKSTWLDLMIKLGLISMAATGLILSLQQLGFIIQQ